MRELSDEEVFVITKEAGINYGWTSAMDRKLVRAGYRAGYRAAQAACAPRELTYQCPNYGAMPPSLDHQPAATPSIIAGGPSQEGADGPAADPPFKTGVIGVCWQCGGRLTSDHECVRAPAADPIADLVQRLRDISRRPTLGNQDEAADALERLAKELADAHGIAQACEQRAERAEAERDAAQRESEEQARLLGMSGSREAALLAERDTLRAVVRAADAMALECRRVGLISSTWLEDYDDASAKVKP